jgi:hypothetical protein
MGNKIIAFNDLKNNHQNYNKINNKNHTVNKKQINLKMSVLIFKMFNHCQIHKELNDRNFYNNVIPLINIWKLAKLIQGKCRIQQSNCFTKNHASRHMDVRILQVIMDLFIMNLWKLIMFYLIEWETNPKSIKHIEVL